MKKFLITTDRNGLTLKKENKEAKKDYLLKKYSDSAMLERRWDPTEWNWYTRNNMKLRVKKGDKIRLRLDPHSSLKHYHFSNYERPVGNRYPHWTTNAISIDNARDIEANFTGVTAAKSFKNLVVKQQKMEFEYTGPDAVEDSDGNFSDMHYFAYDLYLKVPNTKNAIWIGPVIHNDGGVGQYTPP